MVDLWDTQALFHQLLTLDMSNPASLESGPSQESVFGVIDANIGQDFRSFLQQYSNIPEEKQTQHIVHLRDTFLEWTWLMPDEFKLLNYNIHQHPRYAYLLGQLRTESTFNPPALLNIGTSFGQDLRYLVQDGISAAKLYACFLRIGLFDASTALFQDAERFGPGHAIRAEAMPGEQLSQLYQTTGSWTAITSNNYLNRFDLITQEQVAHTMLSLLRQEEGSVLLGSVLGTTAIESVPPPSLPGTPYLHNVTSLRALWNRVQQQSGLNLYIEINIGGSGPGPSSPNDNQDCIFFFVEIQPRSHQSEWRVFG